MWPGFAKPTASESTETYPNHPTLRVSRESVKSSVPFVSFGLPSHFSSRVIAECMAVTWINGLPIFCLSTSHLSNFSRARQTFFINIIVYSYMGIFFQHSCNLIRSTGKNSDQFRITKLVQRRVVTCRNQINRGLFIEMRRVFLGKSPYTSICTRICYVGADH